jgi:hypothetical protein
LRSGQGAAAIMNEFHFICNRVFLRRMSGFFYVNTCPTFRPRRKLFADGGWIGGRFRIAHPLGVMYVFCGYVRYERLCVSFLPEGRVQ